jgi:hypothetical protein
VFERFSDNAGDVIIAAQAEASLLRSTEIGTEHLLLGIIQVRPGLAELFPGEHVLERARAATGPRATVPPSRPVPYSADANEAIEHASRLTEAAQARTEPEHLLLAILAQQQGTAAHRLLTALRGDPAALAQWASQRVAAASPEAANGRAGGPPDLSRHDELLLNPSWSRRIRFFYHPWIWGPAMEAGRRRRWRWLLAACVPSLGYAAWAIAVYSHGQLGEAGHAYTISRNGWTAALLALLTLCFGLLVYFFGKGLRAMAEGWRIAGVVKGCLVGAGYVAAGLLPLALCVVAALYLSTIVFGREPVSSLVTNLGSVGINIQVELLILIPVGCAVVIFASSTPFWHYSFAAPMIAVLWTMLLLKSDLGDEEFQPTEVDEVRSLIEKRWSDLLNRPFTVFGAEFIEQTISAARVMMLVDWYRISGDESLLDEALASARAAADACLRNPERVRDYFHADTALGGLADALWAIYEVRPDEGALRDAIRAREQMVNSLIMVTSAQSRLENVHKLSRLQTALYELTGNQEDLDRGLKFARWAARSSRPRDGFAARSLTLGLAQELLLDSRLPASSERTPAGEPSGAALSSLRAAEAAYRAGAAREGQDEAAECSYRLAMLLARKSGMTGDASDREEALRLLRDLTGEGPAGSGNRVPDEVQPGQRARFMIGHADVIMLADADDAGRNEAVALYKAAAAIAEAPAVISLEAACGWGYHAADSADAAAGLERAVELLTLAVAPGLGYDTTRRLLGRWAELPVDAAAAQLRVGRPERAIELLEHGRTVMWSRRMDLWNAPLDEIGADHPELRKQIEIIRAELLANIMSTAGRRQQPGRQNMAAERRASLYGELNRRLREFGFGRLTPFAELKAAADHGPVVVLNVSRLRSDALILSKDVPLGQIRLAADVHARSRAVVEESVDLARADGDSRADTERAALMSRMLTGWLWSDVTRPVLDWLAQHGELAGEGDDLPRLWWCPTGWLTFLPVHAAGSVTSPRDSVMGRVVSSYTPNLAQLIRARAHVPEESRQVLILAPASGLPSADEEAKMVATHFPGKDVTSYENPDKELCLRVIGGAAVLHFAGHGQRPEFQRGRRGSPSPGGLAIGAPDAPSFLSARELAELPQARARFAYLSACETATPDNLVPDEATHPAAVLHFGGFPSVIATLYPINDYYGLQIAESIYGAIVRDGVLDERHSARALHDTLIRLRRGRPGFAAACAAYMHFGP